MKNFKHFAQKYVDWVIRLGKVRFSLLGVCVLAIFALCTQMIVSLCIVGTVYWRDIIRSVVFGLISAPFVIYFFTLLVEKLERSRLELAKLVDNLRREVSDRIVAEKKLSVALDNLEQNNRDKTALMATISHELRTPLNGIIGLSQILLDEQLTEQQRNYLKTINVSAVSLGHIFGDIIDLQKIDAHRIELNPKEVDLQSFLNDMANFATLLAEQKNLKFTLHYDHYLPNWFMLDQARLSQILWNLINNAVKFTPKGQISLQVNYVNNHLLFSISDSGIGIPESELENIFTMYYQVKSNGYKTTGSGIGLAISKTIAQLMGGDLTVQSKFGKGSTFTLSVQAKPVDKPLESPSEMPHALSILLIEDIEVNVVVAKSLLEKLGCQVDVAMTGKDAIEKFEQNYYDLLLIDIQLPDMSGFDIAHHLRHNYEQGVYDFLPPLIALTANVMQSKTDYQQKGMDDVLRKPISLEQLIRCFNEYFDGEIANTKISTSIDHVEHEHLNFPLLIELIDVLDVELVKQNLMLFQSMMPEYMAELNQAYRDYQQDTTLKNPVLSTAHKIKGAAASVGLLRVQQLAALAQDENSIDWQTNIGCWIDELAQYWWSDVEELSDWLEKYLRK